MTFDYIMQIPLQTLSLLCADFDGDVLNVYAIINEAFYRRANKVINPRKSMYISNNDGKLNKDVIPTRDTLINSNTMINLSRKYYTSDEIKYIQSLKK